MTVDIIEASCSTGALQHTEALHGIVPGLITVQVAPLRRPLGAFHQLLCRHRSIMTAKQNIESYLLLIFPKSTLMVLLRSSAPLFQLVFNNERRFFLQGRENQFQGDWYGGEHIRAMRWSGHGFVARDAL